MDEAIVLRPGAEVTVLGGISASVRSVLMEGEAPTISYKVAWINGADIREAWVDSFMVSPAEKPLMKLGFR